MNAWLRGSPERKREGILLGTGGNGFVNHANAWLLSGSSMVLGAGNLLRNDGYLSPGDLDRVQTTVLSSDFVQTSTGT